MSGLRRILNNTLISLLGQLATWSSTLILTITFVALIGVPIEDGFNQQLIRNIADDSEKALSYLWNTLLLKTMLWIPLYALILVIMWALHYSLEQQQLTAICGIDLLIGSIVTTFAAIHYAYEQTLFPSVGMILEKALATAVGFVVLKNGASVEVMAWVLLAGSVIDVLWVAGWVFAKYGVGIVFEISVLRRLFRGSIPFILYSVLGVIYYRIDTVLLSLMTNTAVVGWYGAAYRLFDTLLFVPNIILNAIMYPVFSKLSSSSREETLRLAVEKCLNFLLICSFPIAALMIMADNNIIGFLYHQADFDNAGTVLQALAPGLIFLYLNTLFSSLIVVSKKEKRIPWMAAAALVFNLTFNLILIPFTQQNGAALVTSLTELLLLIISLRLVPRNLLPSAKSLPLGLKTLGATLVMSAAIYLMHTWSILLIAPLALLIYAVMILVLRAIPREDFQAIYQAFKQKNRKATTSALAQVVDESIYTRITQPIPVVLPKPALVEANSESRDAYDAIELRPTLVLNRIRVNSVHTKLPNTERPTFDDDDMTEPRIGAVLRKPRLIPPDPDEDVLTHKLSRDAFAEAETITHKLTREDK
jgi:O-antigen/teichoic acid export membrane protein